MTVLFVDGPLANWIHAINALLTFSFTFIVPLSMSHNTAKVCTLRTPSTTVHQPLGWLVDWTTRNYKYSRFQHVIRLIKYYIGYALENWWSSAAHRRANLLRDLTRLFTLTIPPWSAHAVDRRKESTHWNLSCSLIPLCPRWTKTVRYFSSISTLNENLVFLFLTS